MPHEDFLQTIVTPVYVVLREEIKGRAAQSIDERVMYDDVNETFWHQSIVRRILHSKAVDSRGERLDA